MPQPPPPLLSPTAVPLPTLLPAHSHLMTVSKCDTSPHVSDSGEPAVMRRRWCCVGGGAFANTPAAAEDAVLELAAAAEKDAPRRTGEPVACCSTAGCCSRCGLLVQHGTGTMLLPMQTLHKLPPPPAVAPCALQMCRH